MRHFALTLTLSALASYSHAATFELVGAWSDIPYAPPAEPDFIFNGAYYSLSHAISSQFTFDEGQETVSFDISFGSPLETSFSLDYSATWTFYSTSSVVLADNVSCIADNVSAISLCDDNELGGLQNSGGFTIVDVNSYDGAFFTPIIGPPASDFVMFVWGDDPGGDYLWAFSFAEVPVPAAAWLFGSALIGLIGVKRKK